MLQANVCIAERKRRNVDHCATILLFEHEKWVKSIIAFIAFYKVGYISLICIDAFIKCVMSKWTYMSHLVAHREVDKCTEKLFEVVVGDCIIIGILLEFAVPFFE